MDPSLSRTSLPSRREVQVGLRGLAVMTFSSIGIIYSDIGTSPLYVLNGIFRTRYPAPTTEDSIGAISAVIWALTLVPLIKYCIICLRFGTDEGEGGVFAVWTALFPRRHERYEGRSLTGYSGRDPPPNDKGDKPRAGSWKTRWGRELLRKSRYPLLIWAFFGTSLVIADGILTPAVSVVTAVGGIGVARSHVNESVVPISIGFLVALFLIQSLGTRNISYLFAPITMTWLLLLGVTGIINITSYPGIFRAFDPSRAIMWFVRTNDYDAMSGVLLALTGSEGIFANLGQFNVKSIQIGFSFVYINLVLAYLGQGAKLCVAGPEVISNIFYLTIPGGTGSSTYWALFIFAILSSLVASQTMITATFSVVQQLVNLDCCPRFRMKHTSETLQGQIYFSTVNYALMVGVIAVVAGFGTADNLKDAYGFVISTVFFITTTLVSLSIIFVKGYAWPLAVLFFVAFGFLDGIFWGSSIRKIPVGAWFPLALGIILTCLFSFYTWGRHLETLFDDQNTAKLSSIIYRTSAFAAAQNGDSNDEDDDEGDNASSSFSRTMQDKTLIVEAAVNGGAVGAPPLDFNSRGGGGGSGSGRGDEEELEMEEVRSPGSAHPSIISGRRSRTGGGAASAAEGGDGDDIADEEGSVVGGSDFESDEEEEEESDFRPQENLWLAMPEGHLALPRISTLAIFHKSSPGMGRGIPHAFTAFLRRWPALPRVVVFLSKRIVGQPYVALEDRYIVTKVRSLEGFYAVTVRLGYRDDRPAYIKELVPRLCAVERASDAVDKAERIEDIIYAAKNATHILPNYILHSAIIGNNPFLWLRRILIEEIYARLRQIFPDETSASDGIENEVIRVGVVAHV